MNDELRKFTKQELIAELKSIEKMGWIENVKRKTNDGALGNKLEDLLGIPENNLPMPNAVDWELKTQRENASSLVTLFHLEPAPTGMKLTSNLLVKKFGWPLERNSAARKGDEKSFRATLCAGRYTRGFTIKVEDAARQVQVIYDSSQVRGQDLDWSKTVPNELETIPYWGFQDLFHKAGTKLRNMFLVLGEVKTVRSKVYFHYRKAYMLKTFSIDNFVEAIRQGKVYVDFDARTGHNHGVKFRISRQYLPSLFAESTVVIDSPSLL